MSDSIDHIAVVIPARNEADRLGACLESVRSAVQHVHDEFGRRVRVSIVVVLDSCTDDSGEVASRFPGVTRVHAFFSNVGAARAAGVRWALSELRSHPDRTWIANTDADSSVPVEWLSSQVRLATAGADVVLGAVEPVRSELTPLQRDAWDLSHPFGAVTGHVHGANLGVRTSAYLEAGGFDSLVEHEDVLLVQALAVRRARIVGGEGEPVMTSGRSVGRTPAGYAGYLHSLETAAAS